MIDRLVLLVLGVIIGACAAYGYGDDVGSTEYREAAILIDQLWYAKYRDDIKQCRSERQMLRQVVLRAIDEHCISRGTC
jgi:hypothetical protein